MKSELWKMLAVSACSLVLTMTGFWFTYGKDLMTHDQVIEVINTQNPYLHDRQLLLEQSTRNTIANENNSKLIGDLRLQVTRIETQLDNLLKDKN